MLAVIILLGLSKFDAVVRDSTQKLLRPSKKMVKACTTPSIFAKAEEEDDDSTHDSIKFAKAE